MRCRICETELPSDASCCYRCGTFIDDTIRQVEPLSVDDTEQTTHVRPRQTFASSESQPTTANAKPLSWFIMLLIGTVGVILGIVGLVAYFSQRGDVVRSETPTPTTRVTLPTQTATLSTPSPKITQTPTPDVPRVNANQMMQSPTDRQFQVARDQLKRDMLQAAAKQAKNRHPFSNLEGCSEQVTQTLAADAQEEWFGVYNCRLRGAIVGENVYETQVTVAGAIDWQNNQFVHNVGNARVTSDKKMR